MGSIRSICIQYFHVVFRVELGYDGINLRHVYISMLCLELS